MVIILQHDNIKLLCYTPETNIMLHISCISVTKLIIRNKRHTLSPRTTSLDLVEYKFKSFILFFSSGVMRETMA